MFFLNVQTEKSEIAMSWWHRLPHSTPRTFSVVPLSFRHNHRGCWVDQTCEMSVFLSVQINTNLDAVAIKTLLRLKTEKNKWMSNIKFSMENRAWARGPFNIPEWKYYRMIGVTPLWTHPLHSNPLHFCAKPTRLFCVLYWCGFAYSILLFLHIGVLKQCNSWINWGWLECCDSCGVSVFMCVPFVYTLAS